VRARFPGVRLTENAANAGFAAATNLGIRAGSAPYVLALNPDTRLERGTLERLAELLEARPEIGIAGCRLVREDGSLDHAARRSFPTPLGALGHFTGLGRHARSPGALAQYRAPEVESGPVDAVNGAFMLIRRSALEQVGLFDEGYWMYMEDLDLCFRFREAGWTTWYEPSVSVVHVKGGTVGAARDTRLELAFHRGMARFYRAHVAPERSPLVNAAVRAGIAAKLAFALPRSAARRLLAGELGPRPWRRARFAATPWSVRPATARRRLSRRLRGDWSSA
jgi:GT2 family glycosyltransferase